MVSTQSKTRHFVIRAERFRDVGSFSAETSDKIVKRGIGQGRAMNGWSLLSALNYCKKAGWEVIEVAAKPK
jgi:hypothetical protein